MMDRWLWKVLFMSTGILIAFTLVVILPWMTLLPRPANPQDLIPVFATLLIFSTVDLIVCFMIGLARWREEE